MNVFTPSKTLVALIVTFVSSGMFSQNAEAASSRHLDNMAVRLQGQAREMIGELRLHYRHAGEYRHLISDAYEIYRLATHIHDLTHHHSGIRHVRADIDSLDRKFHHLEDLVSHIDHHPHGGHVHGNTYHVHEMLEAMEGTLHHLQEDIEELADPHHGHGHNVVQPRPQYRGPSRRGPSHGAHGHGSRNGHSGIRIGNDRFSIRFSF